MNRIVRHHYPVERLPEDLRAGLSGTVTVMVEEEGRQSDAVIEAVLRDPKPMTIAQARALVGRSAPIGDDAVERIRALRDEWDD